MSEYLGPKMTIKTPIPWGIYYDPEAKELVQCREYHRHSTRASEFLSLSSSFLKTISDLSKILDKC